MRCAVLFPVEVHHRITRTPEPGFFPDIFVGVFSAHLSKHQSETAQTSSYLSNSFIYQKLSGKGQPKRKKQAKWNHLKPFLKMDNLYQHSTFKGVPIFSPFGTPLKVLVYSCCSLAPLLLPKIFPFGHLRSSGHPHRDLRVAVLAKKIETPGTTKHGHLKWGKNMVLTPWMFGFFFG